MKEYFRNQRALNSNLFPLFIEVRILKKSEIKDKLERVLISKKSKKIGFISIRGSSGQAKSLGQSALQECRIALLGAKSAFEFWSNLDSLFEDF